MADSQETTLVKIVEGGDQLSTQRLLDIVRAINNLTDAFSGAAPVDSPFVIYTADATLTSARVTTDSATIDWSIAVAGEISASVDMTANYAWSGTHTFSVSPRPSANDAAALGVSGTAWADLFLASAGVINWAAGDITITGATNNLLFAGASSGYTFDAIVYPTANDGAALGDATHNFSDLFLASGGVINWNAGDITITHAANNLLFAGASSGYTFDAIVYPTTNDGAALGDATHSFSDLFLASGGVINWNNGILTLTQASGVLALAGSGGAQQTITNTTAGGATTALTLINSSATASTETKLVLTPNASGATRSAEISSSNTASGGAIANLVFRVSNLGVPTAAFTLNPDLTASHAGTVSPAANDGAALGVSGTAWADLFLASGGIINWNASNTLLTQSSGTLALTASGTGGQLQINPANSGLDSVALHLSNNVADAASTSVTLSMSPNNSGVGVRASQIQANRTGAGITNIVFKTSNSGSPATVHTLNGDGTSSFVGSVSPSANDGAALGVSGTAWADLFLASGAVINFNAGNYTVTHSAGILSFSGAIQPSANDGAALGAAATSWSDLFLASGGIINWNNGTLTLTQSSASLLVDATAPAFELRSSNAASADAVIDTINIRGKDDAAALALYAQILFRTPTVTAGAHSGRVLFRITSAGSAVDMLNIDGTATAAVKFGAAAQPGSNDGAALGVSGTAWSDLFLASGGVINWNAGNVTMTHSAGIITFSGEVDANTIGGTWVATQANQETGTSTSLVVTPGRQAFHPSASKVWSYVTVSAGTPTQQVSYNMTSITDTAQGRITFTIATDFSSANYASSLTVEAASNATAVANRRFPCIANAGQAAGTYEGNCWDGTATNSVLVDPASWSFIAFGDQ